MKNFALSFITFLIVTSSSAQEVFNIESLRESTDAKWTGSIGLNFGLIKNTNDIFWISNSAHIQYKDSINYWLLYNKLNFQKLEGNSFVNRGTQHLRYNRRISNKIKLEAFVQTQYDAVSQIDLRALVGVGPRFKLSDNDSIYRLYLGTLVMYEHEKTSAVIGNEIQKDVRGSAYLSLSFNPTQAINIVSTSYYQPKLKSFSDYRFSNSTSLVFKIIEKLSFTTTFNYSYDALPVGGIPKTQYELTNGFLYDF
ncbi:DUF481 domain-containing protein [Flavobacteriaceae bacterium LMO-SS05]